MHIEAAHNWSACATWRETRTGYPGLRRQDIAQRRARAAQDFVAWDDGDGRKLIRHDREGSLQRSFGSGNWRLSNNRAWSGDPDLSRSTVWRPR